MLLSSIKNVKAFAKKRKKAKNPKSPSYKNPYGGVGYYQNDVPAKGSSSEGTGGDGGGGDGGGGGGE